MTPEEQPDQVPVVGVGASSGGIEAFRAFLAGLPDDPGCAVVFLQHMEAGAESHLAEVLGKDTDLPVTQTTDDVPLEAGHVYVAPPGHRLTVDGDTLRSSPAEREEGKAPHLVDDFLRSLAEARGRTAVGVVLSGNLRDGTDGLRAVRDAGGFTYAQDPETAAQPGMPRNAISAGVVDDVLAPDALGAAVGTLVRDPLFRDTPAPPSAEARGDDEDFERIFELLEERVDIDFSDYKEGTLRRRIQREIVSKGVDDLPAYVELLESDPEAVDELYKSVLIGVTAFFRDDEVTQALEEEILPDLMEGRSPDDPIRIWVPGCSTGEEAYSLALTTARFLEGRQDAPPIQVFGTDIDEKAIETARAGWYPDSIEEDVPQEVLQRYFEKTSGGYKVSESVRGDCIFAVHDITRDPPFSDIDIVSCRNVLIYLERNLQERVLAALHYALRSGGHLILAEAESVGRAEEFFRPTTLGPSTYRPTEGGPSPLRAWAGHKVTSPRAIDAMEGGSPWSPDDLEEEVDDVLVERYGPAAVVVTLDGEAVSFRGETGRFLQHDSGEANLQLRHLLRRGLEVDVMKALREAADGNRKVRRENLRVEHGDGTLRADVEVRPISRGADEADHLLVVFEEVEGPSRRSAGDGRGGLLSRLAGGLFGSEEDPEERVEELETELERVRQELRTVVREYEATNEELRAAHEEALSTNEELQSTNEELETAKEELQSTNEELTTLNQELQERNAELQRTNDDLRNILASVDIPMVMVNADLEIRRFTEAAEELLNLIPSDVGRPLRDIRTGFEDGALTAAALDVLDSLQEKHVELEDVDTGTTVTLKIRPYRTDDDRVDGAVLVFMDG